MDIQLTPEDVKALRIRDKVEAMRGCAIFYETVIVDGREIPNLMMKLRDGTFKFVGERSKCFQSFSNGFTSNEVDVRPRIESSFCCRDRKFFCVVAVKLDQPCNCSELRVISWNSSVTPTCFHAAIT